MFKLREFKIPTTHAATGRAYAHPANPSFDNPIVAVHQKSDAASGLLKFETSDGVVGEHPPNSRTFSRVALPANAVVKRIRVYTYNGSWIEAIEFFNKEEASILKTNGRRFDGEHEVVLEDGERLVAIRSTLMDDGTTNSTVHCNMTLVIGRME